MQINTVQSTNFGMAYKVAPKDSLIKAFKNISDPKEWKELKIARDTAINAVKDTKFANVIELVNDAGTLQYQVETFTTIINNKGEIDASRGIENFASREEAVQKALEKEPKLEEIDKMRREQVDDINGEADHNSLEMTTSND